MKFVADLHIHSHYSRATSKKLDFEHLTQWAQLKGVNVVGTGDIAHPGWLQEMRDKLAPAEEGLFRLKPEVAKAVQARVPAACHAPVRFMLAGEISSIYKKNDQVRKIHNVIFAPTLEAVEKIQAALEKIGNIRSDGRPILGLDSRDLLEIILDIDPQNYLIPAHIWTPWFSLLGSKSGFDTVEECFDDLTPHIFAVETGLSSDPPMNWRISFLDRYTLVSNSDAHSPQKLAREANLFETELSYPAIFAALQSGDPNAFLGTVEFFPEEGKYHHDGHRKCSINWQPKETIAHDGRCPVCGKKVTVGVLHRVETLADREPDEAPPARQPFTSLIPLPEILSEVHGVGPNTKTVQRAYHALLAELGPELTILQDLPLEEIEQSGGALLAEGIRRVRRGEVNLAAGYDGEFGVIKLFEPQEQRTFGSPQLALFEPKAKPQPSTEPAGRPLEANNDSTPSQPPPARGRSQNLSPSGGNVSNLSPPDPPKGGEERQLPSSWRPVHQGENKATVLTHPSTSSGCEKPPPEPVEGDNLPRNYLRRDVLEGPESAASISQPALFTRTELSPETLLAGLNPQQQAAVRCLDASLLIVAGPGTGKTRTLTTRIAYLVTAHGVAPENVLAITFTNKAAGEMNDRLQNLLGGDIAGRLTIKTFHAFGLMLLRETAAEIGLPPNFAICSEQERLALLKRVCPEMSRRDLEQLLDAISTAKSQLLTPDELNDDREDSGTSNAANLQSPIANLPSDPQFVETYRRYETALAHNQLLDFDDLVLRPVQLLERRPDLLDRYRQRFRWLSVDEYQDINLAQYRLLRLLADPDNNLCAIGDPDQAIYGFRGADRRYFLSFEQDFPGAKTLSLSRNYRSTQLILDASGQVIRPSPGSQARKLRSDIIDPARVEIYRAATDKAEAEYVVHQIERRVGGTSYFSIDSGRVADEGPLARTFADFAVLYRLGAQRGPLLEAFERSGIPFQSAGQTSLYEQKPVRRLLAYLWFTYNPNARLYLETILGPKSPASTQKLLDRLAALAEAQQRTLGAVVQDFKTLGFLSGSERKRLANIAPLLAEVQQAIGQTPLARLIEQVGARLGLAADDRQLRQLVLRAVPFEQRLADFLESTVLRKETDFYDPRADRVALMTLHAAKGLEFPVVFIVGCEEGLLPYQMQGRPVDPEEERRLFYVGMTRAQERLILTHAGSRFLFGQRQENAPSRFVDDIEAALKELKESSRRPVEAKAESRQLRLF